MNLKLTIYQYNNIYIRFMKKSKTVVIIGAGLSGLTAAEEILNAEPSCEVIVL